LNGILELLFMILNRKVYFFLKGSRFIEIQLMYAKIDFENQQYEISDCIRKIIGKDFQGDLLLPKPDFNFEMNGVLVALCKYAIYAGS